MQVIPAIDLKDGRCVRLEQGQMSRVTVYSEFPEKMAERWHAAGAEKIHIVDLDGAVQGRPVNARAIEKIVKAGSAPVQLGGGIRDLKTIEAYLNLGIQQVILGTVAYRDPDFVKTACDRFPHRIIIGIDAKNNQVAVEGWNEETDTSPVEMAKRFEETGIAAIIYTDILRDGMRTGPNIKQTGELAKALHVPVIASGGISGIEDVKKILTLQEFGVTGMITGRALYEDNLDLVEAIKIAKIRKNSN